MTLKRLGEGIYLDDTLDIENKIDSIIFDCDGVLIDITKSYDLTIRKTTDYILKNYFEISNSLSISFEIIDGFKATGGFNDEVDLTYAAIISIFAAKKLKKNEKDFIFEVIKHADQTGIISVEKYIEQKVDISKIKNKLNYPGTHHQNLLYSIFDQIFYGPVLYSKLFGKQSQFSEPGLIENDIIIVNYNLLSKLRKKFYNNLAIVSGRGIESIRHSLKELLNEFSTKNSAFLEDESRELAKPNPKALIRSIEGLKSSHCLFVGDSMEDYIMAQKATKSGKQTTFCGITGTSKDPEQKRNLFESNGVSIILDSIDLLPKILNLD